MGFLFLFLDAEAQLIDSLSLDTLKTYESLEDALKEPLSVIRLKLRKQKLKAVPAEVFISFPNLQYLDLSKNKIVELPESLGSLRELQFLNLSKNKLSTLPNSIGTLKNLKHLNVNQNEISTLPWSIGDLENLTYFDLWSNEITAFPKQMSNLKKLKVLDVRVILFTDDEKKHLQELLPHTLIHFSPGCNCGK